MQQLVITEKLSIPLVIAIQAAVDDKTMGERAAAIGANLRAEDGVGNAVALWSAASPSCRRRS